MQTERRKHPRVKLKYKITIICDGQVLFGMSKGFSFHTLTENLSQSGVMVKLEQRLKDASIIRLRLFVTEKAPFECKGSVAWTKKANPENTKPDVFETGIQFIELGDVEQRIIANLIKNFTKKQ